MATVGYARVSSTGQELYVQIDKLAECERVFKEKQSAVDADRPELKRCLNYIREAILLWSPRSIVSLVQRLIFIALFPCLRIRASDSRSSMNRASTPHLAQASS